MSNLLKHLSPLAPDDSGACGVFYELGGITVICDAGGCAGNVCGFDEPRWHEKKSALFSAGLRDMDAILGRDKLLIDKLAKITEQIPAAFTAIIGTPVPAVIATDYSALQRMAERKTGLPCITIESDGTRGYDFGEMLAYSRLFRTFAKEQYPTKKGKLGVIGATPLNTGLTRAGSITNSLTDKGWNEVVCLGMDSDLSEIVRASECEKILVISPSGIKAAEYMQEKFDVSFETGYPVLPEDIIQRTKFLSGKHVLIVHQQFAANALRNIITNCDATCATWFMLDPRYALKDDFTIRDETTFREAVQSYDVVIADKMFRRAARGFSGEWIDFPHYAVSGAAEF
ncbi:MAG: hypothetical protein IKQ91_01540 [Oscillospiraceae bacterium]|nr:hypothetical protein [Oscillospiraceae bacterium]